MGVEEQTQHTSSLCNLRAGSYQRSGQRLVITDRKVTKLAFYASHSGTATGDVTFTIRRVSDDGIIVSKVWGDASALPTLGNEELKEVEFNTPVTINEEVYLCGEFAGGSGGNEVQICGMTSDVKADERYYWFTSGSVWAIPGGDLQWDLGYRYTYAEPAVGGGGGPANLVAAGII